MEQAEMIERIRQKAFFKNNGMVLKAVNLLRDKFVALTDIRYALEPSMTEAEFRDSINYLTESGYIRLRHMDSKACTTLGDTAMEHSIYNSFFLLSGTASFLPTARWKKG